MNKPNQTPSYDDIIDLPHHVSETRPQMAMTDRAAQFSPFAALTGYEAAIEETARLTDRRMDPDGDLQDMLDRKQRILTAHLSEQPLISITYFIPDPRKDGGRYESVTGRVLKLDLNTRTMLLTGGQRIPLDDIWDMESEIFNRAES